MLENYSGGCPIMVKDHTMTSSSFIHLSQSEYRYRTVINGVYAPYKIIQVSRLLASLGKPLPLLLSSPLTSLFPTSTSFSSIRVEMQLPLRQGHQRFFALFLLIAGTGESFQFTCQPQRQHSHRHRHNISRPPLLSASSSPDDGGANPHVSMARASRRDFLTKTIMTATVATVSSLSATPSGAEALDVVLPGEVKAQEPKNRRFGGLAARIRTVVSIMVSERVRM